MTSDPRCSVTTPSDLKRFCLFRIFVCKRKFCIVGFGTFWLFMCLQVLWIHFLCELTENTIKLLECSFLSVTFLTGTDWGNECTVRLLGNYQRSDFRCRFRKNHHALGQICYPYPISCPNHLTCPPT